MRMFYAIKSKNFIDSSLNKKILLFTGVCVFMLTSLPSVFADHIFDDPQAFGQYLDIAQIGSPKYVLEIDDHTYDVYYGFRGSLEIAVENINENLPIVSSMEINSEQKSLEISFSKVPEVSVFWVRVPFEVMTAENENFQLFIDGKETKYDLTKFPSDYAIGMIIPKDSKQIEIVGTTVVPEFGAYSILIFGVSVFSLVYLVKSKSFGNHCTRIN